MKTIIDNDNIIFDFKDDIVYLTSFKQKEIMDAIEKYNICLDFRYVKQFDFRMISILLTFKDIQQQYNKSFSVLIEPTSLLYKRIVDLGFIKLLTGDTNDSK